MAEKSKSRKKVSGTTVPEPHYNTVDWKFVEVIVVFTKKELMKVDTESIVV
jgi:hypothetical protein